MVVNRHSKSIPEPMRAAQWKNRCSSVTLHLSRVCFLSLALPSMSSRNTPWGFSTHSKSSSQLICLKSSSLIASPHCRINTPGTYWNGAGRNTMARFIPLDKYSRLLDIELRNTVFKLLSILHANDIKRNSGSNKNQFFFGLVANSNFNVLSLFATLSQSLLYLMETAQL